MRAPSSSDIEVVEELAAKRRSLEARKTSSNPSVERWSTCYVEMQTDLSGVTESFVRANSCKAQRFTIVPKSKVKKPH